MTTLAIIVAVLCAGAVVTCIGTLLIERAHRPRGRFIDVGGFPQHVIEMGRGDAQDALPVVMLHGASANLEDMRLALAEVYELTPDRPLEPPERKRFVPCGGRSASRAATRSLNSKPGTRL